MQTETRHKTVSRGIRSYSTQRTRTVGYQSRGKGTLKAERSTCPVPGNDFLKTRFTSIPLVEHDIRLDFNEENSRDWIFECIGNYLTLSGQVLETRKTDNPLLDINVVSDELLRKLPGGVFFNYELDRRDGTGCLSLILHRRSDAFNYSFGFLPIAAADCMPEPVAEVFKWFVSFLIESQHFPTPDKHQDFEWTISESAEELACNNEDREYDELLHTAQSYLTGDFAALLGEIRGYSVPPEEIISRCNELLPTASDRDGILLNILIDGAKLLQTDKIMHYDYNPDGYASKVDEDVYQDDWGSVEIDRTVCIVWKDTDPVVEYVMEILNNELQNAECHGFIQYMILTPETDQLLSNTGYPKLFETWFVELFKALEDYGRDN